LSSKKKISGIYCIRNIVNNDRYIGLGIDIMLRWYRHKKFLKDGAHKNTYLQNAYNLYGCDNFEYTIIQLLEPEEQLLKDMEIYWIAYYNSFIRDGGGYNLTRGGEGCWGRECSEETIEKLRNATGMGNSPLCGTHWSDERKMSFSIRQLGENNSFYNKKHSDETKKTISEKGIGRAFTEESKSIMSQKQLGENNSFYNKKHSDETKKAIAIKSAGRKARENTYSLFVGVSFRKKENKWRAYIAYERKRFELGLFTYEIEAAMAYNEAALELYGFNAKLNIISNEEIENLWRL
jgi:group I intron endonuclease